MKAIITWSNGHITEWICQEDELTWLKKIRNNPIILADNAKVIVVKK